MSAGWVAGTVRARALARRRVGVAEARRLAASGSLEDALALLAATPYRIGPGVGGGPGEAARRGAGIADAGTGGAGLGGWAGDTGLGSAAGADGQQQALAVAQHAIAAALLWNLRVLAGWLPQGSARLMRTLAGWFEIANMSERLAQLSGRPTGEYFKLGALATAWPQLGRAASLAELRAALAASAWHDPGGDTPAELEVGMRARWAQRVAALGPPAQAWAAGALVLLLAGERFGPQQIGAERIDTEPVGIGQYGTGRPVQPVLQSVASRLLGQSAAQAETFDELAGRLPRRLAWVLESAPSPGDLWRAEVGWWARAEREAHGLLAGSGFDSGPVIGTVLLLAADARRTAAALEIAARGGGPIEVFDAVA